MFGGLLSFLAIVDLNVARTQETSPAAEATARQAEILAKLSPAAQRRMLRFVNRAQDAAELTESPQEMRVNEHGPGKGRAAMQERPAASESLPEPIAKAMIAGRPVNGYREARECLAAYGAAGDLESLGGWIDSLGPRNFGEWKVVTTVEEPVMHAALLHTGKVLMIPSSFNTAIWDSATPAAPPVILPGSAGGTGLTADLFCSGHSFLSDGRLLVVGGGGGGPGNPTSIEGWIFDPIGLKWRKTKKPMAFQRWYPTAVTLGDEPGRVLIASGATGGGPAPQMEIYSETSDSFDLVTATGPSGDLLFEPTYPGLHLLPGGEILHVPTGFGDCSQSPSGGAADPTAIFSFSTPTTGAWTAFEKNHRLKGMSALLLKPAHPFVRSLVVGGGDVATNAVGQTIGLSSLSPKWDMPFALLEPRVHPNVVLLPDGTVFICGGMETASMPPPNGGRCELYDPVKELVTEMDMLTHPRHYHSMAILLPDARVMAAGGAQDGGCSLSDQRTIEIFSPPYLFRGPRPAITATPSIVEHGVEFTIETPTSSSICKVVLARPMAVTHQTDSEQRIVPLTFCQSGPTTLKAMAPGGKAPNSIAPRGYYMLFILDQQGVPSVSKWIYLN